MDAALIVNLALPRFTWKEGASTALSGDRQEKELPAACNAILGGGAGEVYKNASWA